MESNSLLFGNIESGLSLIELFTIVKQRFERTQIRESTHYASGKYIRTDFGHEGYMTFEKINPKEYLIKAEAELPGDLLQLAAMLDKLFKQNEIKLIFEVYDRHNNLYASDKLKR
ncbi:hypothetical protein GXP67_02075 [Rhodocytophaga rosea]|uniref:Uncharacterized protein n=1 Tax=Rhodocytophaga rosea TaxID=2704465 RepID=A0A6C0GCB6_9BACT|nr:hypothetical protein [Rhodocytophaga rosea]QHT65537.1 hypothetical protein GXP67_02075 [Rhodocytophaga rosea]